MSDLEHYVRHWNLRLHGVPEVKKEDMWAKVTHVCQERLPSEKEKVSDAIDVTHSVGKLH